MKIFAIAISWIYQIYKN